MIEWNSDLQIYKLFFFFFKLIEKFEKQMWQSLSL